MKHCGGGLSTSDHINTSMGEQLHLQTRRPLATVMLVLGAAIIVTASERLPFELAATATHLRWFLGAFTICAVGAAITIRRGVHHPSYIAFNLAENAVLTIGVGLMIVASGSPHTLLWLIYFSTVLHGAHAALYRKSNYVLFTLAPLVTAIGFAVRGEVPAAVLSFLLGATALYLYRLFLAATDHRNQLAREHEQLQRRLAELAVVEERERIARDLHDGLGANLTAAIWQTRRVPEVPGTAAIEHRLMACLDELGALVWATRRDDRSFDALWSHLQARCNDLFGEQIAIEYILPTPIDVQLSGDAATAVLFIVFEALRNAARHADARSVQVTAHLASSALTLEIRDDGSGIAPDAAGGHGLRNMEERAKNAGGALVIRSRPGETAIEARIPVSRRLKPS